MNRQYFFAITVFILTTSLPLFSGENRVYSFGPETGPAIIFTTPDQKNQTAIKQLERFAAELTANPPLTHVYIIISANDFRNLPADIDTAYPEGTRKIISMLTDSADAATVILLLPGKSSEVLVRNGIRGATVPSSLLETVTSCLIKKGYNWKLEEYRLPLYRIGWIPENELLGTYIRNGIPAVMLETDIDCIPLFTDMVAAIRPDSGQKNDTHYLIYRICGHLLFFSESQITVIIILATAVILFFLFFLSFLLGEQSEQHMKDFLHVWWVPFLYLAIHIAALYLAQLLTQTLSLFRFGRSDAWQLMRGISLAAKSLIAIFLSTLIVSFNQRFRFPEKSFIYGYIAGIMAMINIFVFSALDFSLAPVFLVAWTITFIFYHKKKPVWQLAGMVILAFPFLPYLKTLISGNPECINPLFTGDNLWNIRIALFIMPFQFLLLQLKQEQKTVGKHNGRYLSITSIALLCAALVSIGILLFLPAWSKSRPLQVHIRQRIDTTGNHISIQTPVELHAIKAIPNPKKAEIPDISADPAALIKISYSSKQFLERQLATITITPMVHADKIEMTVSTTDGISVYDASYPFELQDGGLKSVFSSGQNPGNPFVVNFSSPANLGLTITVRLWSRTNPYGLSISNPKISTDYLLEVERTIQQPPPQKAGGR